MFRLQKAPLALAFEPVLATKLAFLLLRVGAAPGLRAGCVSPPRPS